MSLLSLDLMAVHLELVTLNRGIRLLRDNWLRPWQEAEQPVLFAFQREVYSACLERMERLLKLIPRPIHMIRLGRHSRHHVSILHECLTRLIAVHWDRGPETDPLPFDDGAWNQLEFLKDKFLTLEVNRNTSGWTL